MATLHISKRKLNQAFSLVELSIVLVILGLLVGGVLSGQSLIRASGLRSVSTDLQRHQAAIYAFRDKYLALPGDMTNATNFWNVRAGTGSDVTCHQTINTPAGTCNGDGDGHINNIAGDTTLGERFAAWQHLANARLVEGSYTGATAVAGSYAQSAGVNIPQGKLSNSRYEIAYVAGPISGSSVYFDGPYAVNIFIVSSSAGNGNMFKPEEMWNIDTKMDDGKPATGVMWTYKNNSTSWSPGCATTDVVSTAEYALTSSSPLCTIQFALR